MVSLWHCHPIDAFFCQFVPSTSNVAWQFPFSCSVFHRQEGCSFSTNRQARQ